MSEQLTSEQQVAKFVCEDEELLRNALRVIEARGYIRLEVLRKVLEDVESELNSMSLGEARRATSVKVKFENDPDRPFIRLYEEPWPCYLYVGPLDYDGKGMAIGIGARDGCTAKARREIPGEFENRTGKTAWGWGRAGDDIRNWGELVAYQWKPNDDILGRAVRNREEVVVSLATDMVQVYDQMRDYLTHIANRDHS